jgi:hypothetical protein
MSAAGCRLSRMSSPIRGFLTSFRFQVQIQGNLTGFRVQVPPRTQIHVRFPRFGTRLNTGRVGNLPHAHCPVTSVGVTAALFAVGRAFLALGRLP